MATYEPNQPYHNNINAHIRNAVPSPSFDDSNDKNVVIFSRGIPFNLSTERFGDPHFLAQLSRCLPIELEHAMVSWQYHQKAHAQDVLPFLFLGPMSVARDPGAIVSTGITMLLAVRDGRAAAVNPKIMNPARFASAHNIETATFDVINEFDLIQRCHTAIKLINDHLQARTNGKPIANLNDIGGKVLVFCEAGDKRSAALVVLFLMVVFGLNARDAIQAVQARRYGISINGDLYRAVQNFEDIVCAERQVATALFNNQSVTSLERSHKRGIDQTWEQDEEMEMEIDLCEDEMFRFGTAPFKDKVT